MHLPPLQGKTTQPEPVSKRPDYEAQGLALKRLETPESVVTDVAKVGLRESPSGKGSGIGPGIVKDKDTGAGAILGMRRISGDAMGKRA